MPEPISRRPLAFFFIAFGLGTLGWIVLPRQCASEQRISPSAPPATAPAPASVASRIKQSSQAKKTNDTQPAGTTSASPPASFADKMLVLSRGEADENQDAIDGLMSQWAASDPAAAAEFIRALPAGDFLETASVSLCQTWAAQDPVAAAKWVAANLPQGGLDAALGAVTSVWGRKDPEAVAQWVSTLLEEKDRLQGIAGLATTWGEMNPAAAAAWWQTLSPEGQSAALQPLLLGWANTDPAAAAAWLQGAVSEHPSLSSASAVALIDSWTERDPGEVSRWLNSLPDGPFYQSAVAAFAQSAAETAPKDALVWARALTDPSQRQQAVLHGLETWLDNDRTGFLAALPEQLNATNDPALRQAVYDLLYRKDPNFKASLLKLADTPTDAPAAEQPAGGPEESSEAQ